MSLSAFQMESHLLFPLLGSPSLRNLKGTECCVPSGLGHWRSLTAAFNLRVLDLDCCEISSKALSELLTACKALKSLRLLYDSRGLHKNDFNRPPTNFYFPELEPALHQYGHSLESLEVI